MADKDEQAKWKAKSKASEEHLTLKNKNDTYAAQHQSDPLYWGADHSESTDQRTVRKAKEDVEERKAKEHIYGKNAGDL